MSGPRYQHFHDLPASQFEALKKDISVRGVLLPIVLDENGRTIDGHQRRRACAELDIECPSVTLEPGLTEDEKHQLAITLNLFRRQLGGVERTKALGDLARVGMSTRRMADVLGLSKSQIHRDLANIERPDTVTDTLGREQPSSKPPRVPSAGHVEPVTTEDGREVDPITGEVLDAEGGSDSPSEQSAGSALPVSPPSTPYASGSDHDGGGGESGQGEEDHAIGPEPPAPVGTSTDPVLKFNRAFGIAVNACRSGVLSYKADIIGGLDHDHRKTALELIDSMRAWCDSTEAALSARPKLEAVQ